MKHWISCKAFTVRVETDAAGRITWAAPVVRKFLGQPLDNMLRWAGDRPPMIHVEMEQD